LKESKGEMNYNEVRKTVEVNDLGKNRFTHCKGGVRRILTMTFAAGAL
jgi:hypothetical protein